jgi:hypothetical protein
MDARPVSFIGSPSASKTAAAASPVGRPDLVPQSCGFRATPLRVRHVSLGEPHPSPRQGRAGDQRLALEAGGHPLQLVGRGTGSAEVAGRDLDLHLRLE